MRNFILVALLLGIANALFAKERSRAFTINRRAGDSQKDFFPFPANKSSIVSKETEPKDTPEQDLSTFSFPHITGGQIPRHFIEKGCDAGRKFKIESAWTEAKKLADAQTNFQLGYNYDIPHTQWLGKDWNSESSWIPWKYNYRKLIGDNLSRLRQLFSDNAQSGEYIYWYCYDYASQCTGGVQAYSWDSIGFFWSNHYIVFCDPFFGRSTMDDLMVKHQDNEHEQKVMENFHLSREQILFHEVWHFKDLVSRPRTGDYAYQAQNVWNLAKEKGTGYAYVNADSYATDAVAIYVQQYYKSSMSPVPWKELGKLDATAAAAVSEPPSDDAMAKTFIHQPPGWNGPLVTDNKPDLSAFEEIHLNGPKPEEKDECHGISGDYWVMSRDVAIDNIRDFCSQGHKIKEYNADSVNNLQLSVRSLLDDSKGASDAPDCASRFQSKVIDDCDGNDPVNNPHNYKFGATFTSSDGWEYTMRPLSKQVNEVNCDVSYKFFYDSFEVRGKNFPSAKLGTNGDGLKKELSGCGSLTKWKFEETPDDCCFQWYASGHLPIGTKSCVGRAVVSAGGSGKGNCHGAGKRDANFPAIDAWPGYGDDSKHVFRTDSLLRRDDISALPGYGDERKHVFRGVGN